jgi:glycosidase
VLGNHDRPRLVSRIGPAQARVAAILLLTLRGTPTLYYGDEIGMKQVAIPHGALRDHFEKNVPGIGIGRDGCRTLMQWDSSDFAGFSSSKPWLPLATISARKMCQLPEMICTRFIQQKVAVRRERPVRALPRGNVASPQIDQSTI